MSGEPRAATASTSAHNTILSEAAPEKNATYGSVTELRDAVEAAGYECTDWQIRPRAANAAEMADCDFSTVLMTYATEYDKQTNMAFFEQNGGTLLIGPNWIVNGDPSTLDKILPKLGGIRWSRPER